MTAGTPPEEVAVDAALLRGLLDDQHPDLAALPITPMEAGWDNHMFRLGSDLVVRMPRREVAAALVVNEQTWLPVIAPGLPLRVPVPLRRGEPGRGYPWRWSIVPWLAGGPASETEAPSDAGEARRWAAFLRALHRPAPEDAPENVLRGVPLADRAEAVFGRLARLKPTTNAITARVEAAWHGGLEAAPSRRALWLHGDLHAGNVLVERGRFSAVVDWGDITSGDPATDLASVWALFADGAARGTALRDYGADDDTRARAMAWAVFFGAVLLDTGLIDNARHAAMGTAILERLGEDI